MVNGQKIRKLREEAGMTLVELAAAAGVSTPQLSYIESSLKDPSVKVLENIANRLSVTVDELLNRSR